MEIPEKSAFALYFLESSVMCGMVALQGPHQVAQKSITIIKMSFVLSLLYNIVGLSFAVTGNLLPLVAAIIMPLSTITIVGFVTVMSNYFSNSNLKSL